MPHTKLKDLTLSEMLFLAFWHLHRSGLKRPEWEGVHRKSLVKGVWLGSSDPQPTG